MSSPLPPNPAQTTPVEPMPSRDAAARPARKLDLSRVAPPENLDAFELEEITIDGICGVY